MLFLIEALRNVTVGTDTRGYFQDFEIWRISDISSFFVGAKKDAGLKIITKVIALFTNSNQIMLAVVGAFFAISISWFIYKYSKEPSVSFIALLSLGYVYFSMAGLKQIVAISVCLFSYKYIKEQRIISFLIFMVIAYLFHNTAIIFVPAYFLPKIKIGIKQIIAVVVAFILANNFQHYVRYFIFNVISWDRLSTFETRGTTNSIAGFIIQLSIMIFCLCFFKKVKSRDFEDVVLYNFSYIGLIIQPFSVIIGDVFRVSMYFSIFNIILIANAIASEKNISLRLILKMSVILIMLLYFFVFAYDSSGVYPYQFFWE
jgi:hypothetical protein